jgi:hypothetical protein
MRCGYVEVCGQCVIQCECAIGERQLLLVMIVACIWKFSLVAAVLCMGSSTRLLYLVGLYCTLLCCGRHVTCASFLMSSVGRPPRRLNLPMPQVSFKYTAPVTLIEAAAMAAVARPAQPTSGWLAEVALLWVALLASAAALEAYARREHAQYSARKLSARGLALGAAG